ncbi:carbon starvation protein [Enterococcus sp. PF1-24]|uniref:carbon starvation CstA family protein n=1 Tax=unclassified Enterococcus TaxID=2608891 RepID=UPI00247501DB|nr:MULTISPECIES: carbon starvation protein A [unclassified Enterococcus]MDH6363596.1 carbon starvation protein [Enterococcus sp. PFB1-1]MDH6400831.1 carbon starvation protein [Enterococcus sp. PF1-24]
MSGVLLLVIAIICFIAAYFVYSKWLETKWGIDRNAKTPAYTYEDGVDYVPEPASVVFSHQFSSITGAGPVTGPIIAAKFGWLPAFLWIVVGGIFFGAAHDFGAMYASVKNEGKSIGLIIERYIGKTGKKLFLLFSWLFSLLVIAAFGDIVANTFNGKTVGVAESVNTANASAASISMIFILTAMVLGILMKKFKLKGLAMHAVAIVLLLGTLALGIAFPIFTGKDTWLIIVFVYLFLASVTPMWLLMAPRDFLSTYMLLGMIVTAVVGLLISNPTMELNVFNGFAIENAATGTVEYLFPILFITIACGAVSGFHSLVSSGTSSKQIRNEKDMRPVSYGAMMAECVLAVAALVVAGAVSKGGYLPEGTPFQIFSSSVAGFLTKFGLPTNIAQAFMTMCISALALTSLDSVARIGRMALQEFFTEEKESQNPIAKALTNKYVATVVTLICGYVLSKGGYNSVWPLFGSANQLLAALVMIAIAVFLKTTKRSGVMFYIPMYFMLAVTFTALSMSVYKSVIKLFGATSYTVLIPKEAVVGQFVVLSDGLQLFFAIALLALGVLVATKCLMELHTKKEVKGTEEKVA